MIDPLSESLNNFTYDKNNHDFPPVMKENKYMYDIGDEFKKQYELDSLYESILEKISKQKKDIDFIRKTSKDAVDNFNNNELDFVF